jgi:hypothetical protein
MERMMRSDRFYATKIENYRGKSAETGELPREGAIRC